MAGTIADTYLIYSLIKRMVTPFNQWDAYRYGIIDDRGNVKRKRRTLTDPRHKRAWGRFDIAVANLKKALERLPGGQTKLASMAAAAWIFKEEKNYSEEALSTIMVEDFFLAYQDLLEDGPANAVGGGAIAGVGIGPDGEPPMGRAALMRRKNRRDRMLKRFTDAQKMWIKKAEKTNV